MDNTFLDEDESMPSSSMFLITWMKSVILAKEPAWRILNAVNAVGLIVGALGAAVNILLSYEFGEWLAQEEDFSDSSQKNLGVYFAVTAYLPICVLAARTTRNVFVNIVKKITYVKQKDFDIYLQQEDKFVRFISKLYFFSICIQACIAAIADMYNSYEEFYPKIDLWASIFIFCDFFAPAAINGWSLKKLSDVVERSVTQLTLSADQKLARKFHDISRLRIKRYIFSVISVLENMNEESINLLHEKVFAKHNCSNREFLECAYFLLNPNDVIGYQSRALSKSAWKLQLFKLVGGLIGAISAYIYWPLAKDGSITFLKLLKIENQTFLNVFGDIVGFCAFSGRGALAVYAGLRGFDYVACYCNNIINWFKKKPQPVYENLDVTGINADILRWNDVIIRSKAFRCFLTLSSLVVGVSASTPRIEQVLEFFPFSTVYGELLVFCGFIGTFSIRFWTLELFYEEVLYKKNNKKVALIDAVAKLLDISSHLSDNHAKEILDRIEFISGETMEESAVQASRGLSVSQQTPTERFFRKLGRVFNPINDCIIGFFVADLVQIIFLLSDEEKNLPQFTHIYIFLAIGSVFTSLSLAHEFWATCKMRGNTLYLIGDNTYNQTRTLQEGLQSNSETSSFATTKMSGDISEIISRLSKYFLSDEDRELAQLIKGFQVCYRYNQIRQFADYFSIAISGIIPLFVMLRLTCEQWHICQHAKQDVDVFTESGTIGSFAFSVSVVGLVFILKSFSRYVDERWDSKYSTYWDHLSPAKQKIAVVLKHAIDIIYNFTLGFFTMYFAYKLPGCLFNPNTRFLCKDLSETFANISSLNNSILYLTVFPALYAFIHEVPTHNRFKHPSIFFNLKRGSEAIFQSLRIVSLLMLTLMILHNVISTLVEGEVVEPSVDLGNGWNTCFAIISVLGMVATFSNSFLNYREPDSDRMVNSYELWHVTQERDQAIRENPDLVPSFFQRPNLFARADDVSQEAVASLASDDITRAEIPDI